MSSFRQISNLTNEPELSNPEGKSKLSLPQKSLIKGTCQSGFQRYCVRAKYYNVGGALRLASVQSFTVPKFAPVPFSHFEDDEKRSKYAPPKPEEDEGIVDEVDPLRNLSDLQRATRRAKITAFDKICANDDMTLFATLTYDPARLDGDTASYEDVYHVLKPWLSNLVSRHGFKYVIAPERHKKGGIHFHMICNAPVGLRLDRARSAVTGCKLTHKGHPLYRLGSWRHGFSSAEYIGDERLDRDRVAKYIFKYMGKQVGAKVGGRYLLSGGDFVKPLYVYGDDPAEFLGDQPTKYDREVDVGDGIIYREFCFI